MADVELHSATSDFENPVEAVLETGDAASEAHEEHAASDVVGQEPNAQVEPETLEDNNAEADATPDDKVKDADGYLQEATQPRPEPESDNTPTESVPAAKAEAAKKTVTSKGTSAVGKDKLTISTKNPSSKTNPSTPTVKKVCRKCFMGHACSILTMCGTGSEFGHVWIWCCEGSPSRQGYYYYYNLFHPLQIHFCCPLYCKEIN